MRYPIFITIGALLLAGSLVAAQEAAAERDRALAVVKKLGGSYQADANLPGQPIVMVDLSGTTATDADVAELKVLTQVRALNLNLTKVTDGGLVHLKGMKQLEELGLGLTSVGDPGMVHLKGLTRMKRMDLRATKLTDVGLGHLQGLKDLEVVDVDGTQVTDKAVTAFRKALPKVEVIRQVKPKP
jgi:hypothetical protein